MPRGVRGSGSTRQRLLSPEEARAERERLQAQLQQLEDQATLRYALVGRAVAEHAEADTTFAQQLQGILEQRVTNRGERVILGLSTTPRRGGRRPRATGSQAGMAGPITASTSDAGPTGPAES